MRQEHRFPALSRVGRAKMMVLAGLAILTISGVVIPKPAFAWWRGGVWVAGPGYYPLRVATQEALTGS